MIALLRQAGDPGDREGAQWAGMRIHRIASEMLTELGASSKLNAEWEFFSLLRDEGRRSALCPPIDREILPLNETSSPKFLEHRDYNRRTAGACGHAADAIGPPGLLSARDGYSKQRQRRCTPDKGNELPPPHWAPHGR